MPFLYHCDAFGVSSGIAWLAITADHRNGSRSAFPLAEPSSDFCSMTLPPMGLWRVKEQEIANVIVASESHRRRRDAVRLAAFVVGARNGEFDDLAR